MSTDNGEQQSEAAFSKNDIVIVGDADHYGPDPFPGIILKKVDEKAGEFEAKYSDGEVKTISEHHGEAVRDDEDIYYVREVRIVDGDLELTRFRFWMPDSLLKYYGSIHE